MEIIVIGASLAVVAAFVVAARTLAKRANEQREAANSKAAAIIARASALEAAPGGEYFAASVLKIFEAKHGAALDERASARERSLLPAAIAQQLNLAEEALRNREQFRETYNKEFVNRRLREQWSWFNGRKTRLTEDQRQAVVTDEDATLVVAAAGSGKTATIVAKAEYLVRAGLARPEQICLLAFNTRASEEIAERLAALGVNGATVSTIHALGYGVHGMAGGSKPPLSPLIDDRSLERFIARTLRGLLEQDKYRKDVFFWIWAKRVTAEMLSGANTPHERLQMERSYDLRTLTGVRVRSQAEVKLADWMTLHGISWEYERPYSHRHNNPTKKAYQPDFYLPEANAWVELWALNRDGRCAPNIDAIKYRLEMDWKREQHKMHGTLLVEVWQDEIWNDGIDAYMRGQLEPLGLKAVPLTADQTKTLIADEQEPVSSRLSNLIKSFLALHRGGLWSMAELTAKAWGERERLFLSLYQPVILAYEAELKSRGEIDFDDMMGGAVALLPTVKTHRFKYVLVDEFQDSSRARMELIKQLRSVSPGARLFLVGDDWQPVYRFAGADLGLFTQVEKHLGTTARVMLGDTFRLLPDVADVSSRFVIQNPSQIQKVVNAAKLRLPEHGIVLHGYEGDKWLAALRDTMDSIEARSRPGTRILLLSRYRRPLEDRGLKQLTETYRDKGLTVETATMHRSKGLEADHVVVIGMSSSAPGFPSATEDDPVLQLVSAAPDPFLYGEERRLMYVALTRSRGRVYLLYPEKQPSTFVEELLQRDGANVEKIGKTSNRLLCPRCKGRTVSRREGEGYAFWSCMHWPQCDGRLDECPSCDEGAMVSVDTRVSECSACKSQLERCPKCAKGNLFLRKTKIGQSNFWGCSEWRADGSGCNYTRNASVLANQRAR